MRPWKTVIGRKLKARSLENRKTEAKIGVRVLNRMTELGWPNFESTLEIRLGWGAFCAQVDLCNKAAWKLKLKGMQDFSFGAVTPDIGFAKAETFG
jgi:hypothetical protein